VLKNRRWSVRTLLYFFAGAIVTPATALLLGNVYNQYRHAESAATTHIYSLAQIGAGNARNFIADGENTLKIIGARLQAQKSANSSCDSVFSQFRGLFSQFANLSLSSPKGYLLCSSEPQREQIHTFIGETPWFKQVYAKKRFIVSPPFRGIVTHRLVSVMSHPLMDESGNMVGSLQLPIDLVNYRILPGKSNLTEASVISIYDSQGTIITRSEDAERLIGTVTPEIKQFVLSGANRTGKFTPSQGSEQIYGVVPIANTDWYAVATIPTNVVLKDARDTAVVSLVTGSSVLLLLLLSGFYFSRMISEPIVAMQKTTSKVAAGDHSERVAISGPKEILEVGTQFNLMMDAIEANITESRAKQQVITKLAFFDPLTELPNRALLSERIEQAIEQARLRCEVGAIIYIDLDRFKDVNDSRGHSAGDALLKLVAQRLSALVAESDTLARMGGDEFVFIATQLGKNQEEALHAALALGARIRASLESPFEFGGHIANSSASIGITLFPKVGDTGDALLQEADMAMYRAKDGGRNRLAIFEHSMRRDINDRVAMETDLKTAMQIDGLHMHVQPQLDRFGQAIGAELLLRWTDPVRGPISPAQFIPIAEESDLIVHIGSWVLEYGCQTLVKMQNLELSMPLSLNVSPRQFRHPGFVEQVCAVFSATGANPSQMIFEVTEGLLINDMESTIARMNQLAEFGIRFSIDDFGTGYSSLAYLKRLPLYELKIDKSFVKDTPGGRNDTAIVQSILGMARHLGLHVVAEGVETTEQLDFLIANGCNAMQGNLLGRPMPVDEWMRRFSARRQSVVPLRQPDGGLHRKNI